MKDKQYRNMNEVKEDAEKAATETGQLENEPGLDNAIGIYTSILKNIEAVASAQSTARQALDAMKRGDVKKAHELGEQVERLTYGTGEIAGDCAVEKFTECIRDYKMDESSYYDLIKRHGGY